MRNNCVAIAVEICWGYLNEICTADPAIQGILRRSFAMSKYCKKRRDGWNLGLRVTKTYHSTFCGTLYSSRCFLAAITLLTKTTYYSPMLAFVQSYTYLFNSSRSNPINLCFYRLDYLTNAVYAPWYKARVNRGSLYAEIIMHFVMSFLQ